MTNRIVLVGNPNTGKTTLFNSLTGKKEKTANYSGVTVKEKETLVKIKNNEYSIVDLPGLYSFFNENTEDEVRASSYIEQNKESIFCFVMTDLSIQKNLYLLTELSKKVYKVVIFINQMQKKKVNIDIKRIQEETGVLIIYESAKTVKNIVLKEIYNFDFKHNKLNQYSYKNLLSLFNFEKVKKQEIDAFLLHKFWGRIFAIFVFCFIVWFSYFSFGNFLGKHIFKIFTHLGDRLITKTGMGKFFTSYLYSVLFVSCGAVISFLPQLVFLLFSMYLLEESGYLPRISYLFNGQLEKINLNGRSIFSLVVGVGCTTSGYLLTKNVPNSTRKNCAKLIPFVGCSAKFPILIFFAGFISNFISAIYVLMVLILVVFFGSLYLFATGSRDEEDFILEIPRIKMPRLKECLKKCLSLSLDFLKRVLGIVFLASSILWLLKNITTDFSFEENSPKSILNMIAGVVKILFKPIGLDDNNIIISLLTGLVAKENIVASLMLLGGFISIDAVKIITFMIFVCFYSPCLTALKSAKIEFGSVFALKTFIFHTLTAYFCSFVFYTFSNTFNIFIGFLVCFASIILLNLIIKCFYKKPHNKFCKTCFNQCIKNI